MSLMRLARCAACALPQWASRPQQQLLHASRLPAMRVRIRDATGCPHRQYANGLTSVIASEAGKTKLQGYLATGFIVNNIQVEGPILCYSDMWMLWNVTGFDDVTPDSLAFLDAVTPAPEVLVLGCGPAMRQLTPAVSDFLRARGIALELLDTRNAVSYFNFLNDEGRIAVGALLPYSCAPFPEELPAVEQTPEATPTVVA